MPELRRRTRVYGDLPELRLADTDAEETDTTKGAPMLTRRVSRVAIVVLVLVAAAGCHHTPPTLSPQAALDFNRTRVIGALDIIRDTAIAGSAAVPPVISDATTRRVVQGHRSALKVMDAASTGWQLVVATSLDELLVNLPPNERVVLAPYVALGKTVLNEVAAQ
jgi:hypothetical protein